MPTLDIQATLVAHKKWIKGEEGGTRANLRGANLTDANLRGANLTDANLRGANLTDADLRGANLTDANLRGANLRGANLTDADLRGADLTDADLRGADLTDANLRGANLRGANLRGADLTGALGLPVEPIEGLRKLVAETVLASPQHLDMGSWHGQAACGTTHCIAGWACTLAPGGKELEGKLGVETAATLLLGNREGESGVFYLDNAAALEVLKGWAQEVPNA